MRTYRIKNHEYQERRQKKRPLSSPQQYPSCSAWFRTRKRPDRRGETGAFMCHSATHLVAGTYGRARGCTLYTPKVAAALHLVHRKQLLSHQAKSTVKGRSGATVGQQGRRGEKVTGEPEERLACSVRHHKSVPKTTCKEI